MQPIVTPTHDATAPPRAPRPGRRIAKRVLLVLAVVLPAAWLGHAVAQPARPPAAPAAGGVAVQDVLALAQRTSATAVREGRAGRIIFDLPNGFAPDGITSASVFADADGRPAVGKGFSAQLLQNDRGELDLGGWLRKARPGGPHYLLYCVRGKPAAPSEAATCFLGWERLEAVDLYSGSLRVRPGTHEPCTAVVRMPDGTPVPGALVSIELYALGRGLTTLSAHTGKNGLLHLHGLDRRAPWIVSLPAGLGPSSHRVEAGVGPETETVVLTPRLGGRWSFDPVVLERVCSGQTLRVLRVDDAKDMRRVQWPTSPLLLGARDPCVPLYVMRPAETERSAGLTIRFARCEPLAVPWREDAFRASLRDTRPLPAKRPAPASGAPAAAGR